MADDISVKELTEDGELNLYFVLWVDIAGYSLLPLHASKDAVEALEQATKLCPSYIFAKENGIVQEVSTGDGFGLIFQRDAFNPVRCALELRAELKRQDSILVRMGIHIGPALEREQNIAGNPDIHGDAANMAARAMNLADPGEILLTEQAYEIVKHLDKMKEFLEPAGTHIIKHSETLNVYRLKDRPDSEKKDWLSRIN